MATKYASFSSYHYAYNNPVMSNDPSGADPQSDVQTQFSYMLAMEKLRQELADMARKALLEQYPFYDGPLDPTAAAVYYGMQQEAERQREASLLARARRGDMQAIREYASTHGGLVRYEGAEAQALFSGLQAMEEAKLGRKAPAGPPTPSGGAQSGVNIIVTDKNNGTYSCERVSR